ncbi:MAG: HlyC/CorC family transporter [Gemmatimonadetes bacterium]|nr:HlyC/CorC family transporter [Gemmatimonadota bacterium]
MTEFLRRGRVVRVSLITTSAASALFASLALSADALAAGGAPQNLPARAATETDVYLLVTFVVLALLFSFLCSIAEAALLSITPSFVAGLQEQAPERAALIKRLKHDQVDRSLAAILTLNTIAHTVGAIGSGAKATLVFGSAWFGLFSAIMTLAILFLSEIIPKTLGAVHWRRLAYPTALFVKGLITVLYPLIWISERLTRAVSGGKSAHVFNREEFLAMSEVGQRAGKIDDQELWIMRHLFRLRSMTAEDVMTPRTVIVGFPEDATVAHGVELDPPYSRLPIYRNSFDEVTGFVLKDDFLRLQAEGKSDTPLHELKRPVLRVPWSVTLSVLLQRFLDQGEHIAVVIDEHGGTDGIVTLEDVLETLLGTEIMDEADTAADLRAVARGKFVKRAEELGFDVPPHPDEEETEVDLEKTEE